MTMNFIVLGNALLCIGVIALKHLQLALMHWMTYLRSGGAEKLLWEQHFALCRAIHIWLIGVALMLVLTNIAILRKAEAKRFAVPGVVLAVLSLLYSFFPG